MRPPRPATHRRVLAAAIASIFLPSAALASAQADPADPPETYGDGQRRWTVNDSVALRYLSLPGNDLDADNILPEHPTAPVLWSPDRRYFLTLVYRGDLACDCLRYTLSVYDAAQINQLLARPGAEPPAPVAETTIDTDLPYLYMPGISSPRWLDNESVVFVGLRDRRRQLFRLSIPAGGLAQLTDARVAQARGEEGFGGIDRNIAQGNVLAFTVPQRVPRPSLSEAYPSVSVSNERLTDYDSRWWSLSHLYISSSSGGDARAIATCLGGIADDFSLSPDGRWLAVGCRRLRAVGPDARFSQQEIDAAEAAAFWLIDTRDGSMRYIAPATGGTRRIIWRSDGMRVALVGAVMPDEGCEGGANAPKVASFELAAQRLSCVTAAQAGAGESLSGVTGVRWEGSGNLVVASATERRRFERTYSQGSGSWRGGPERDVPAAAGREAAPPTPVGLQVQVRQDLNRPWSLVATLGDRTLELTPPDPALAGLGWAPMREVSWQEGSFTLRAGLILPRDYRPGTRLPLVIQLGDYVPGAFLADGSGTTIFAAQALAAQGFAVINVDVDPAPGQPYITRPDPARPDVPRFEVLTRNRIDAVIDTLDAQGLIDSSRVGLVGFSFTGFQTHFLATRPGRRQLAAAIVADSTTGSYGEYNYHAGAVNSSRLAERMSRRWGGNFWENRDAWVQNAPLFNVQNVTAPILFEQHRGIGVEFILMEQLAAYRVLNKPFDYFLFPNGEHQLRLPRQRAASMGNNVSWMAFWLQGREIPGLQTEETYARWRRMRELRNTQASALAAAPR